MINNMIKSKEGFKYMSDTLNNSSQIKLEWNKPKFSCLGNLNDFVQQNNKTGDIADSPPCATPTFTRFD